MKKQGFTLIELMVVVVIIGILAAVAVPKLFGMIAKSKASEVGPAAGTYVKLQQAYMSESNVYGSWKLIGYTGPGEAVGNDGDTSFTTNFGYGGTLIDSTTSSEVIGWDASNLVTLNDCDVGAAWLITNAAISSVSDEIYFTASMSDKDNCEPLTPTFTKIGK